MGVDAFCMAAMADAASDLKPVPYQSVSTLVAVHENTGRPAKCRRTKIGLPHIHAFWFRLLSGSETL